jgi:hypothetical protein
MKNEWPRSKTAVRVIKTSAFDEFGRCSFDLLWWQDGRKRAQCFHARPEETRRNVLKNIEWSKQQGR